ncbi:hypothetical protein C8Q80DRAFT_833588 [Daedaleopsis nitida]|nr:hypothetical protein C8Q80DRAFT_833588 [Daedaleopsis nitida]
MSVAGNPACLSHAPYGRNASLTCLLSPPPYLRPVEQTALPVDTPSPPHSRCIHLASRRAYPGSSSHYISYRIVRLRAPARHSCSCTMVHVSIVQVLSLGVFARLERSPISQYRSLPSLFSRRRRRSRCCCRCCRVVLQSVVFACPRTHWACIDSCAYAYARSHPLVCVTSLTSSKFREVHHKTHCIYPHPPIIQDLLSVSSSMHIDMYMYNVHTRTACLVSSLV